jgi:phosphatidylinositol glycan class V
LEKAGIASYNGLEGLVAICIAHAAHLLSVFALFNLSLVVFPGFPPEYAFTAASLHIISPAGLFLSAPYAESSCALLSFVGCLLFTKSLTSRPHSTANQDFLILASGICFGIATTFRSNGMLNGLLLLEEAFRSLFQLRHGLSITVVRRLAATGVAGMSVAAGFLLPQYIAYIEFCGNTDSTEHRPWCGRTPPSIYTFVQDHYWYAWIPLALLSCLLTQLGTLDSFDIGRSQMFHFSS